MKKANLELYNERDEIDAQIAQKESKIDELNASVSKEFSSRLDQLQKDILDAEDKLYNEIFGIGATKKAGDGPAAQVLRQQVERLKADRDRLEAEQEAKMQANNITIGQYKLDIEDLKRQKAVVNELILHKEKEKEKATAALDGFTARLKAMSSITSPKEKENRPLFIARMMIMLLFIAIEIIPTLFKMMMTAGPYDNMLKAMMYRTRLLSEKQISDVDCQVNSEIQITVQKNANRIEAEIKANKEVLDKIAMAQAELLQEAIDAWREQELAKIRANPSEYIRTNMSDTDPIA